METMQLVLTGISHETAPVEFRERLAFSTYQAGAFAARMRSVPGVEEALVLSTCNRTEFLLRHEGGGDELIETVYKHIQNLALSDRGLTAADREAFYIHRDSNAVRHILRVACGLESMITGEGQIISQVKQAFRVAHRARASGPVINKTMHAAFRAGKRARGETDIGVGAVSVSLAAVRRARTHRGNLAGKTALIVGAGDTARSIALHLHKSGIGKILVANRTGKHAAELAARFGGTGFAFSSLAYALGQADVVFGAAMCEQPLIERTLLAQAMEQRPQRPMWIVDVAVPRSIAPDAGTVEGVVLRDIDDVKNAVDRNLRRRRGQIPVVEAIIEEELGNLRQWYAGYLRYSDSRRPRGSVSPRPTQTAAAYTSS